MAIVVCDRGCVNVYDVSTFVVASCYSGLATGLGMGCYNNKG